MVELIATQQFKKAYSSLSADNKAAVLEALVVRAHDQTTPDYAAALNDN